MTPAREEVRQRWQGGLGADLRELRAAALEFLGCPVEGAARADLHVVDGGGLTVTGKGRSIVVI